MLSSLIEPAKAVSAALMAGILGVVGVAVFFWMASTGWQDIHGVGVGIIFITLSIAQIVFGIFWYRAAKKDSLKSGSYDVSGANGDVGAKEMSELRRSPAKEAGNGGVARESMAPLLTNRESAAAVEIDAVNLQQKTTATVESQA